MTCPETAASHGIAVVIAVVVVVVVVGVVVGVVVAIIIIVAANRCSAAVKIAAPLVCSPPLLARSPIYLGPRQQLDDAVGTARLRCDDPVSCSHHLFLAVQSCAVLSATGGFS